MEVQGQQVDIQFTDLTYIVNIPKQKQKKTVLKSISGTFKTGELTAIMGPSGAGKSSLLNILTGFVQQGVRGSITIGNKKFDKKTRKQCSYILQDDNLFPWFTVEETMKMAAKFKLSQSKELTKVKMMEIIDNVLDSLNLKHTKKTKCSNLSGGQKKRLSIALEMLDNPPVLFLDEPTTGLDSSASTYCIKLLHDLAREGRTIVCTIHQPSATIFELFDHVYTIADGNCIYQGSPENTVAYLSSNGLDCPQYHNAADYLLEVANNEYGCFVESLTNSAKNYTIWRAKPILSLTNSNNHLNNNFIESSEMKNYDKNTYEMQIFNEPPDHCNNNNNNNINKQPHITHQIKKNSKEFTKLGVLIKRGNIQFFRDWTVTHLKLLLHILCAIIIGLLFDNSGIDANKAISNISFILVGNLYLWYTSIMPAVLRFPSELGVLKKEIFNNWYKINTYYISTLITSAPIQILFATVYSSIAYFMTYQPLEFDRFLKYLLIHILLTLIADGYGVCFGTLLNPINGTFIGAIVSCFMLAFSGCLALFTHMPKIMYYISFTSPLRYGLEGCALSILGNGRSDLECPEDKLYCHYMSPKFILNEFGLTENNYLFDIVNLLIQLVVIRCIAYFTLKRKISVA